MEGRSRAPMVQQSPADGRPRVERTPRHHGCPRDPDWSKNSPVATEIVDILNGALKAMGGWPRHPICCGAGVEDVMFPPPQMVEAFNKVCKKLNEDKLFNEGLQCRAVLDRIEPTNPILSFCVLVEKKVTRLMSSTHRNILVI